MPQTEPGLGLGATTTSDHHSSVDLAAMAVAHGGKGGDATTTTATQPATSNMHDTAGRESFANCSVAHYLNRQCSSAEDGVITSPSSSGPLPRPAIAVPHALRSSGLSSITQGCSSDAGSPPYNTLTTALPKTNQAAADAATGLAAQKSAKPQPPPDKASSSMYTEALQRQATRPGTGSAEPGHHSVQQQRQQPQQQPTTASNTTMARTAVSAALSGGWRRTSVDTRRRSAVYEEHERLSSDLQHGSYSAPKLPLDPEACSWLNPLMIFPDFHSTPLPITGRHPMSCDPFLATGAIDQALSFQWPPSDCLSGWFASCHMPHLSLSHTSSFSNSGALRSSRLMLKTDTPSAASQVRTLLLPALCSLALLLFSVGVVAVLRLQEPTTAGPAQLRLRRKAWLVLILTLMPVPMRVSCLLCCCSGGRCGPAAPPARCTNHALPAP